MTLPRTKTMVRRSQAAERRILQNKQHMDKYAWNLCKRLKEYYAMALTWMGNPLEQTGGFTFTERGGKVHSGMTWLQTYYVEMERDLTPSGRIGEWSQIVHIFTFAVFEDGYKVGLRLSHWWSVHPQATSTSWHTTAVPTASISSCVSTPRCSASFRL